jgi:hypothetical protein
LSREWQSKIVVVLSTVGAHATSTLMLAAVITALHSAHYSYIFRTELRAAMLPGEQHNATSF